MPPIKKQPKKITSTTIEVDVESKSSLVTDTPDVAKSSTTEQDKTLEKESGSARKGGQQKKGPLFEENGFLWQASSEPEGNANKLCERIDITSMRQNIDTKEMELELVFNQHDQEIRKYISRGMLIKRNFLELMKYGVDVAEHTVSQILVYLNEREKRAPLKYVHSSVGFGEHDGAPIFKLQTAIGTYSGYIGNLLVEPKGSYSEWARIVRDEVLGHKPLELALVMGLAAPVASLVAKESGLEVIVARLYGDSTQGKTTATRLAVSPFGFPHTHKGGLIRLWNSTKNAMFASIRDTHGVPIVFDEASMHSGEFSTLIYQIAGGTERARLNKESEFEGSIPVVRGLLLERRNVPPCLSCQKHWRKSQIYRVRKRQLDTFCRQRRRAKRGTP